MFLIIHNNLFPKSTTYFFFTFFSFSLEEKVTSDTRTCSMKNEITADISSITLEEKVFSELSSMEIKVLTNISSIKNKTSSLKDEIFFD